MRKNKLLLELPDAVERLLKIEAELAPRSGFGGMCRASSNHRPASVA